MVEERRRLPYIDTPGRYRYRCTRQDMPASALCPSVKLCPAVTDRANHVPCLPQQSGSRFQGSRMFVQLYSLYLINGHYYWWYACTGIVFGNHARHVHMHAPGPTVKIVHPVEPLTNETNTFVCLAVISCAYLPILSFFLIIFCCIVIVTNHNSRNEFLVYVSWCDGERFVCMYAFSWSKLPVVLM